MVEGRTELELSPRRLKKQQSTVQVRRQQAVCVRDACKHYGSKKDSLVVLDGLNMTVPKGVIYGLLGASGCGKTTLLNCILGCRKLNSGELWVLGGRPGSKGSGVPGPRVGYMPQDIAQYGEFSIRETFKFYGWIMGLKDGQIKERTDFLVQLLMLPSPDTRVNHLSGGQQRRVSLASALLHEPELLVLDEPTVGLDPILRELIWSHFVDITESGQTTIIITTHYIEETRQAHLVALMRGGRFLAEESPDQLMQRSGTATLEEVFLKLSVLQNIGRRKRSIIAKDVGNAVEISSGIVNKAAVLEEPDSDLQSEVSGEFGDNISLHSSSSRRNSIRSREQVDNFEKVDQDLPALPGQVESSAKLWDCLPSWKANNVKALMWKNFLWIIRNTPMMVFIILIPAIQVVFQCLCIGGDPKNLPVAIVNYETNNDIHCQSPITCNSTMLSCNFLRNLEKRAFILVAYDSEDSARKSVFTGKSYASVVMQKNYSAALHRRIADWDSPKLWNIKHSQIDVLPDLSNHAIAAYLRKAFYETYKDFIRDYLGSCGIDKRILSEPINFETPVFGSKVLDFTEFVAPGILTSLAFALGGSLTAFTLIMERQEGTFDRYLVAGIKETELVFAHFTAEFAISLCQSALALIFSFGIFHMPLLGSTALAVILVILCGVCGMSFGFAISCLCDDERAVNNIVVGSFVPIITFSGVMWPVQGMYYPLQIISSLLPLTQPTEALRSIMQRSWGLTESSVYLGFVTVIVWSVIFMTISILAVKYKKG